MGFLVARDADEPDARLRDQRVRLVDHAKPGPQHRHQQRRIGQPASGGVGQRCAHRDGFGGRIAGGLVHQHQRQIAQGRTECRVVGALVAQCGQPRRGQWVVDDAHIHGPTLIRDNAYQRQLTTEPLGALRRPTAMLVDTDAIRALGAACSDQAADLSAAAAALTSLPGPDATAAFGPVGAGFLAALDDAATARRAGNHGAERRCRFGAPGLGRRGRCVCRRRPTRQPPALAMPSALIAALAAPIREVAAQVGPGWSDEGDPTVALAEVRDLLADVSAAAHNGWSRTADGWSGAGADGAADFVSATAHAADQLALRIDQLRASTGRRGGCGGNGPLAPERDHQPLRGPRGHARIAARRTGGGGRATRRSAASTE